MVAVYELAAVCFPGQAIRCACLSLLMTAGEEVAEAVPVFCGLSGDVMLLESGD